jgi:hypothetical protein
MHRVAQKRAPRIVRKHGFRPVPSYGLLEAHSGRDHLRSKQSRREAYAKLAACGAVLLPGGRRRRLG